MPSRQIVAYRIAPPYRRCCWYVLASCGLLGAVFIFVAGYLQQRDVAELLTGCLLFAGIALAMIPPLRWKLYTHDDGLLRRGPLGVDEWTASDLGSGRVRKLGGYTLYDPGRPWWRRRLDLEYLADGDLRQVSDHINQWYRLPAGPQIGDSLTVSYGFRKIVTLAAGGIEIQETGIPYRYRWSEVRSLHMARRDLASRDFSSLCMMLPRHELELKLHRGRPLWRGATAEQISDFLLEHAPPDRTDVTARGELPLHREQLKRQLLTVRKALRDMRVSFVVLSTLLAAAFIWIALQGGALKAVVLGSLHLLLCGGLAGSSYLTWRRHASRLEYALECCQSKEAGS